jgi:predicted permease
MVALMVVLMVASTFSFFFFFFFCIFLFPKKSGRVNMVTFVMK